MAFCSLSMKNCPDPTTYVRCRAQSSLKVRSHTLMILRSLTEPEKMRTLFVPSAAHLTSSSFCCCIRGHQCLQTHT